MHTNGLLQDSLHYHLHQNKDFALTNKPKLDNKVDNDHLEEMLFDLKTKGYTIYPYSLSTTTIELVKSLCINMQYSPKGKFEDSKSKETCNESYLPVMNTESPYSSYWLLDKYKEIIKPQILIPNIRLLKSLLLSHLNCLPVLRHFELWYSYPSPRSLIEPKDDSAQEFHFDLDEFKWLKVFIYLNDVNNDNGPHTYIPKSHLPGAKNKHLINYILKTGRNRISDETLFEHHSKSDVTKILGAAGTIIIADTKCWHKASVPIKSHRIMAQYLFAPTFWSQKLSSI